MKRILFVWSSRHSGKAAMSLADIGLACRPLRWKKGCQAGPKIYLLAEVVPLSPGTENLTSIKKGPTLTSTLPPPVQSAEVLGTIVPIL
jgi:hypothetical protein